jgi:hypothetical protein
VAVPYFKDRPRLSVEQRRAERELFFWTAFTALKLLAATAFVLALVLALLQGRGPIPDVLIRLLGA